MNLSWLNPTQHSSGTWKNTAALFSLLLGSLQSVHAADTSLSSVIDLSESITHTLSDNPALKAFGVEMQVQEARELQAGIRPKPELFVELENVLGTDQYQALDSAQTSFNITWILERGVRERRIDAARAGVSVIASETTIKRLDAVAETARRYLMCLELQARMTNAEEGIRLAENNIDAIEARITAGSAPAAELARARAELARRQLVVEDIEHELLSAYYRLGAQWGETEPSFSRVSGNIFDRPEVDSFEMLKARLEQTPDLEKFISQQRLQEAQLRLEEARNRQSWTIMTGIRQIEQTGDQALVAGFTMPLGRQNSNRGRVEEVRADLARTALESEAERVRLETELFVFYQELRHSLQLTEALSSNIIPLYEEALTETVNAYEQGRYNYSELNAAQTELLAVREYFIESSISIFAQLIEVERLTGVQVEVPQFSP